MTWRKCDQELPSLLGKELMQVDRNYKNIPPPQTEQRIQTITDGEIQSKETYEKKVQPH